MRSTGLHLIAEAGTNHNRSVETGKRLIDAGRRGGANSVAESADNDVQGPEQQAGTVCKGAETGVSQCPTAEQGGAGSKRTN